MNDNQIPPLLRAKPPWKFKPNTGMDRCVWAVRRNQRLADHPNEAVHLLPAGHGGASADITSAGLAMRG